MLPRRLLPGGNRVIPNPRIVLWAGNSKVIDIRAPSESWVPSFYKIMKKDFLHKDISREVVISMAMFGLVIASLLTTTGVATLGVEAQVALAQIGSGSSDTAAVALAGQVGDTFSITNLRGGDTPVVSTTPGTPNYDPSVIYENGTYRAYWLGQCCGLFGDHILYAEATSMAGPWHAHNSTAPFQVVFGGTGQYESDFNAGLDVGDPTPIEAGSTSYTFDGLDTGDPSVMKVSGTYYMYYCGAHIPTGSNGPGAIGVASSPDGLTWTRMNGGKPIVTPHNPSRNVYGACDASVTYANGKYYMIYEDTTGAASLSNGAGQYLIRSTDPTFQQNAEIFTGSGFVPLTAATKTSYILFNGLNDDIQYVPAWNDFLIDAHSSLNMEHILLFDSNFKLIAGAATDDNNPLVIAPSAWVSSGPGIVSTADSRQAIMKDANTISIDILRSVGITCVANNCVSGLAWRGADLINGPISTVLTTSMSISTKFTRNERVQTTSNLNVRASAALASTFLGTEASGALGTVVGGPVNANGYNWWNINYDNGTSGWSIEDYLQQAPQIVTVSTADATIPFYQLTFTAGRLTSHMFTSDQNEVEVLTTSNGFHLAGTTAWLLSSTNPPAGAVKLYRLYNSHLGTHLYTASTQEVQSAEAQGYVEETSNADIYPASVAQPAGTVPLYRMYNLAHPDYYYTIDPNEYNALASQGWRQEGVAGYVYASNLTPTATLTQDISTTAAGQQFTISWSSTNATSCTVYHLRPDGTYNGNGVSTSISPVAWGTGGTSGSQTATPLPPGVHDWSIDCTGSGGTAHQDLYHTVVSGQ